MRIVYPGKVDLLTAALNGVAFVKQHADAHSLQVRHDADRVVIAQNAIDRPA
jgi:hypothetical protein